ncbi:caspase family protein [Aliiruegeria lutimaris]|nr:caspase family protein [Aliiruegeria lutimaris]
MLVKVLSVAVILLATFVESVAETPARVAMVIGNSAYERAPVLDNPINDATDIAASLGRLGFDVQLVLNADDRQLRQHFQEFARLAETAELSLVYFAGHGIEVDKANYLIPVNAELQSGKDVQLEAIPLDVVMRALAPSDGVKIVLVDACRDNPFADRLRESEGTRSVGTGLGRVDPIGGVLAGGVLVSYAAREGTLALDGTGRNSPYAQALLEYLEEPGLEVSKLFRKVRDRVFDLTNGRQEPFTYGALPGEDIYLAPLSPVFRASNSKPSVSPTVPWMEIKAPSASANIDNILSMAQRRQVQTALLYLGENPGPVDGQFGPSTRRAIAAARLKLALPPSNHVSKQLLDRLPNAPAIDALKSSKARAYRADNLPSNMEPRLARIFGAFSERKIMFDYFEGRLYVVVLAVRADWHSSSQAAANAGGHLVTITSDEENRFVKSLVSSDPNLFAKPTYGDGLRGPLIGLYKNEAGLWGWVTGEPLRYLGWAAGQPDHYNGWETVAALHMANQRSAPEWNDIAGVAPGFVVEVD